MSKKPSPAVFKFMETYGVETDEIWQVHGSAWVIKHKALERVAAEQKITFDRPAMLETNSGDGIVALVVFGTLGDRSEWSIGEAHPKNNKNAYPYAMAEKRAKDRVILKLLSISGSLYSEEEADDFKQSQPAKRENPHVTRAADIFPEPKYDENGEVIDNVPHAEPTEKLTKAQQRPLYDAMDREATAFKNYNAFLVWMNSEATIDRVKNFDPEWQKMFRGRCRELLEELRPANTLMAGA
jgi:hypothetical protein